MADFVIVAAVAMLAGTTPAADASTAALSPVEQKAPRVGFRTYSDAASCERATATLTAPAGTRLVCVPVELAAGEMASAY